VLQWIDTHVTLWDLFTAALIVLVLSELVLRWLTRKDSR
jgi:hypothetical protein